MYKSSDKTHEIYDQYHFYFSAYTIKSYVYNHKKKCNKTSSSITSLDRGSTPNIRMNNSK
jgi:hypothetical protein